MENNTIFVGSKPVMNYVLAVVTQFNEGSNSVLLRARGKAISRAVDKFPQKKLKTTTKKRQMFQ